MAGKKSKKKGTDQVVCDITKQVIARLGIDGEVAVAYDGENGVYRVQIDPLQEDVGILIGRRGETVEALQSIIGQIVRARVEQKEEPLRLLVNVWDWRQRREEALRNIAAAASQRAKTTGTLQHIYDLSPWERRFVHILLASDGNVTTESEGEGRERHLVVKPV